MLKARKVSILVASFLIACAVRDPPFTSAQQVSAPDSDVIVVGAGISGLSAALEVARGGAQVTVMDMASIFGGHAVMSEGGVAIVGTPLQQSLNIDDNPDLAYKDFTEWGEDAHEEWVRYYVKNSRAEIYDWLTAIGVRFTTVLPRAGNSVPRFHQTPSRGLGLVSPLYRECIRHPKISFVWNTKATGLLSERNRVVGVQGEDLRTGKTGRFGARAVILATGGFQSNLALLREYWPESLRFPDRILIGGGVNATGSGHAIAQTVGAVLYNMDHQWNYPWGLPDPRYPDGERGLNARNTGAIWVNAQGKRFVNELTSPKIALPVLLKQQPATYWSIFDEQLKPFFFVSGSDWGDFRAIQRAIFDNRDIVKSAFTIEGVAAATGLPAGALVESVRRYNELVTQGEDVDFSRFGPSSARYAGLTISSATPPQRIEKPPFYALQFFPLARKSMGGILIDLSGRVVDQHKRPIAGLYAAGELTGFAGINGKAGLEGTFLGPSIVTGRLAGRTVLAELKTKAETARDLPARVPDAVIGSKNTSHCQKCHDIEALVAKSRSGYWHFERSHRVVAARKYDCRQCHAELASSGPESHRINRLTQVDTCAFCHVAQ
jgi:flavocytochrome c